MKDHSLPSAETLKQILDYDKATGVFTWKIRPARNVFAGAVAGSYSKKSGRTIGINGMGFTAQRLAWVYMGMPTPKGVIAHRNGDNSDNRISNLIDASRSECNQLAAICGHNTTGMKGVQVDGEGYVVRIVKGGKVYSGGKFKFLSEAKKAASDLRSKLHGEFSRDA